MKLGNPGGHQALGLRSLTLSITQVARSLYKEQDEGNWSKTHLDLHGTGGQGCDFFLHPVSNAGVHGGAPRQDVVSIEVLPDVNITLHDAVVGGFVDASRFHPWRGDTGHVLGWWINPGLDMEDPGEQLKDPTLD